MGYHIEYNDLTNITVQKKYIQNTVPWLTLLFFCIFLLLLEQFWIEGRETLHLLLWPGGFSTVEEAMDCALEQLHTGQSVSDAVKVFCMEILDEANIRG